MIATDHLVAIACATAKRRYPALWYAYTEDCRQEAYLLVYSAPRKHLTVREQFRRADRHFYRVAKSYGLYRPYRQGNRKGALCPREEQEVTPC
jgi:hypothetical protein